MVDVTDQRVARPVGKRDREEEHSAFNVRTSLKRHGRAGRVGTAEGKPRINRSSGAAVPTLQ